MGFEEIMLAEIHEKVHKLHRRGRQQEALEQALEYACTWAFVTGYKIVFNVRIGLHTVLTVNRKCRHLVVFMSFEDINNRSTTIPQDTNSTAGTSFMGNAGAQRQPENTSVGQPGVERERKDVSIITKRWAAERILRLMLRCYKGVPFPSKLLFAEERKHDPRPLLLLSYALGAHNCKNLRKRSAHARNRIIKAIKTSMESANASEGEGSMTEVGDEEASVAVKAE